MWVYVKVAVSKMFTDKPAVSRRIGASVPASDTLRTADIWRSVGDSTGFAWGTTEMGGTWVSHPTPSFRLQSQRYESRISVTARAAQLSWSLGEFNGK